MILFYVDNLDERLTLLEEEEFQHCIKVLRHREGDVINITNGNGIFAEAKIIKLSKRNAILEIVSQCKIIPEKSFITLAIAPPKSKSRWEFLLEKCVEVGVNHIQPIYSQHSERVRLNIDRASKIIRSSALQSKRIIHPSIQDSISFKELMDQYRDNDAAKYIAKYSDDHNHLIQEKSLKENKVIIIGPEGDFSEEEYLQSKENGFIAVNISKNRLRTETAALTSVVILKNLDRLLS